MSSEHLASAQNLLKGNLAGAWDILSGAQGQYTDLGIARRFGGSAAAYSLRDIGAMNLRVVKVRRIQDDAVEDFSALQVASGSIEKFAIGQDVLDLYNNAAYFPTDSDYFSLGSGITLSGAFTISYDVVFTGSFGTNTSRIFQDDAGNDLLTFTTSTTCKFRVGSIVRSMSALSTALQLGRKYSMIFARDGSGNYTLTIDGVQVSSTSGSDTDDFFIQRIGFRNRGSISNLNINSGQHIYAGDGAENSNWTDTGSGTTTNATKVGTPVAFTGQGIDAFIDTWYDQSGNGNNATQTTSTKQPSIVKNGGLVTVNGKPAIDFDGVDNYFDFDTAHNFNLDPSSPSNPCNTIMFVGQNDDGNRSFLGKLGQTKNWIGNPYVGRYQLRDNGANIYDTGTDAIVGSQYIASIQCPSEDNFSIRENGSALTLGGTNNITTNIILEDMGAGYTANYQTMKAQEFYFHNERLTNDIVDIENDAINYYNIS